MRQISSRKRIRLGRELVKAGLITARQLKKALVAQRKMKREKREPLGEILLKLGLVKEKTLIEFLEKHLGIPYVDLKSDKNVDRAIVRAIPERMARHLRSIAIGFDKSSNKIIVAMANPLDIIALDTIKIK